MKRTIRPLLIATLFALSARAAYAQVDFTGKWMLDRELSADLSKASFNPQAAPKPRSTGGGFSGGLGPFTMGRGGGGGRSGGGQRPSGESGARDGGGRGGAALTADEQAVLRQFVDYVKSLAPAITIEHTDHSTFTVTDAQGRSHLFLTDGSKVQQALATSTIDCTTRWDGPHIVTAYTISSTRELVFTYILVPATKQMALRIKLDDSGRQRVDVPELRLVYTLAH